MRVKGIVFGITLLPLQLKFFSDLLLVKTFAHAIFQREGLGFVISEVLCKSFCTQKNPMSGKNAVNQESLALLFIFVGSGDQS